MYPDNRGVVQTLNKSHVEFVSTNHKDADLWMGIWWKVNEHNGQGLRVKVVWITARTTAKEKAQMTQQNNQIAVCNGTAEEIAHTGV